MGATSNILSAVFFISSVAAAEADMMTVARESISAGRYDIAIGHLLPLAAAGDGDAQLALGRLFRDGLGTPQDKAASAMWFQMAADAGNIEGMFLLGRLLSDGNEDVPDDVDRAIKLVRPAAAAGNSVATTWLAYMTMEGEGVEADMNAGCLLARTAADMENSYALNYYGLCLLMENLPDVAQNFPLAREYLERSSVLGNFDANFGLADIFANGWGVEEDRNMAADFMNVVITKGTDPDLVADAKDYLENILAGKRILVPGTAEWE